MNSQVIKYAAGGGKTTFSEEYLRSHKNGLYLAFNNSVVESLSLKGMICKTIDSFFQSFIFPKIVSSIPIVAAGSVIEYENMGSCPPYLKNVNNININSSGELCNQTKPTIIKVTTSNSCLQSYYGPNATALKHIFAKDKLRLTDNLRSSLANYILDKYSNEVIDYVKQRFDYVIFDEAQDLNNHKERLAILLYNSDIKTIFLGDAYQNINGGGHWFEEVKADEERLNSFRCPENNCEWIRNNLGIQIFGTDTPSTFENISFENVLKYNDGKRVLLYYAKNSSKIKNVINEWKGDTYTIKGSKGQTIKEDIVIIGTKLDIKAYYTAITRTKGNVFTTIEKW